MDWGLKSPSECSSATFHMGHVARAWGAELARQGAFYHEPGINAFENLYFSSGRSPEAAVQAWKDSPGHNSNMLHGSLGEYGIAVVQGQRGGFTGWFVVMRGYF